MIKRTDILSRALITTGVVILTLWGNLALALEKPQALATDSRIKVVAYQKNNVVLVRASNLINTQLIFGKNEAIVNYQSGDSAAWSTDVNQYLRNVLNIKPTILGSHTNLDVITVDIARKRRYYRFELISSTTPTDPKVLTYAVQFMYPRAARAKVLTRLNIQRLQKKAIRNAYKNPKAYHWDYSFHGSRSIMPLHVFDDGQFTYLELHRGQDVPAIFAVNNTGGREAVVNYRRVDNTLVIQQIAPQFTLRDGKDTVASIFNNRMIAQFRQRH